MTTYAERLHELTLLKDFIETTIEDAFEKYHPEIWEELDFDIGSDDYDNSLEIYFQNSLPYPWEPCKEVREAVYALGFTNVYWNFKKDVDKQFGMMDEIRNWEPRHTREAKYWVSNKYGYVDDRFDEKHWESTYRRQK